MISVGLGLVTVRDINPLMLSVGLGLVTARDTNPSWFLEMLFRKVSVERKYSPMSRVLAFC